ELAKDKRSPPAKDVLRDVDVTEHMIADVKDLVARERQMLLELNGAPSEISLALLKVAHQRPQESVFGHHFEKGIPGREKMRLSRAYDDDVEEIAPLHPLGKKAIEGVAHH